MFTRKRFSILLLWVLCFLSSPAIAAPVDYPSLNGYVTDNAGLINASDQEAITRIIKELDDKTTAQVAVVTVATTQPEAIEPYAVKLFEKAGIGQKGKNNGVLLLIASQDRTMHIEVGYGLEGALPDALAGRIIREIIVPEFKAGNISQGILKGADAIVGIVAKEYGVTIDGQQVVMPAQSGSDSDAGWVAVLILIFSLLVFTSMCGGLRGGGGYYGGGGFGGGSSGGGFGGFGGGSSGGGGASGSW